ncbi:MAG: helicase-associated domain-containing protein [Planctomycetes bacterium]|nr:helicase-associated domain-containing protein [Planctomycetota bacterium]MCW8135000.1 helicase-associated domain-containing protein [Planctomycetota bacterium]
MTSATVTNYSQGELDLLAVIEMVIARAPRVLKNGLPNLAFFRTANQALAQPDNEHEGGAFAQIEFWLAIARQAGLLAEADGTLAPGPRADAFFALPADQRRETLRSAWFDARDLNEFAITPELELPSLRKGRTVDVVSDIPGADTLAAARRTLAAMAQGLGDEMSLGAFIRRAKSEHPSLFVNHDDDKSWRNVYYRGIRQAGARQDCERDGNWENVEGTVIALVCELPLSRLGFIDYDGRTRTLRPASSDTAPPAFEIVVQPNFEVMALGDRPDAGTLWKLARFTTPQPEGRVRRYRLERAPFSAALGRGMAAPELVGLLESLSRTPLPQNVQFSLRDWGAASERIRIWPDALFIEAEGVEDLSRLLGDRVAALGLETVDGGHRVCASPDAATLRAALPPRRAALDYSRRLPPVITPGEGASLRAPREELHFRARQLLELVSRSRGTDIYELHEATVRASAAALGPAELLQRVRDGLARPLSPSVALAMRTWSGEFKPPIADQCELLFAESPEQAELLEELPELRGWIERKLGAGAYLLKVGGAERAREALKRLGLDARKRK